MRVVITYGTFDTLHFGHINLLMRAKKLGTYLIVGLSTDEFNLEKGKESHFPYWQREELLRSIRYVDQIIPEASWDQKARDITEFNVETFVMGDDWQGEFDHLSSLCRVTYLTRTPEVSSTMIKSNLSLPKKGHDA